MEQNSLFKTALLWPFDPLTRKQYALERAQRKGVAMRMDPLARALAEADEAGVQFYGKRLQEYLQIIQEVAPLSRSAPTVIKSKAVEPQPRPQSKTSVSTATYMVTSATLAQAYAHLTQHLPGANAEPEWMLAVTGMKHDGLRTLEQLIEVPLAIQSSARASFDMQQFARIAITLHEKGMDLHSIWHSHRFPGAPTPSTVDWQLQEILDQGGYPTIQAVFSEDGYIRFFARRPFTITVTGKGVDCVDKNQKLYRISDFSTLPYPQNPSAPAGQRTALRPLSAYSGR